MLLLYVEEENLSPPLDYVFIVTKKVFQILFLRLISVELFCVNISLRLQERIIVKIVLELLLSFLSIL